jgi:hypothetical protein
MRGSLSEFFFPRDPLNSDQENPAQTTLWPEPGQPSLHSSLPGTPFPFLPEPPDNFDLGSFLTSKGVLEFHLDNLQRLVNQWYPIFESAHSDSCNLVRTAQMLANGCISPRLELSAEEQALLAVFIMISVCSGERGGHELLGGYFHPAEWLLIYLFKNHEFALLGQILNDYHDYPSDFFMQIERRIEETRKNAKWSTTEQRCVDHWAMMRVGSQSQLTGKYLFDHAFEVPTLLRNQNISLLPWSASLSSHSSLLLFKKTMHIGSKLFLIAPSDRTTPLEFMVKEGVFAGDVIIELPLPVELLVSPHPEYLENSQRIEEWLGTISDFSFWYQVTGFSEVEESRLAIYAANTYRSDLVQSGQALSLLRQFLTKPIATTGSSYTQLRGSFYAQLRHDMSEDDATRTKIYWLMALLKKVLGPQRPVFTLPPNYDEDKARAVYARLEQMLGLHNNQALKLSSIENCLERLNGDARPISDPLKGLSADFKVFWNTIRDLSGCQEGVEEYQKLLVEPWPSWLPNVSFVPTENPDKPRRVKLEDYAKALANCAQTALYYLNQCAAQADDIEKQIALESFLKALIYYHLFSLFHLEGSSSTDRGEAYINNMAAPYQWHTQPDHLREGQDFFTRQIKDLVSFLVVAKELLHQGVFGKESGLIHSFVSYLTTHYLPLTAREVEALPSSLQNQVEVLLGKPGLFRLEGQHAPAMLGLGFGALSASLLDGSIVPIDMETSKSMSQKFFLALLHLAGHSPSDVQFKNKHGKWQMALPFYLFVVLVSQWVMLRAPIPSSTAGNQNATTTAPVAQTFTSSDIAFGWMMFLTLERLFENFGGCYQVLTHPATQGIFGLLMIATAIALQPLGYDLLDENPDDPNAVTLLVFGNSLLFVMMAGAPFKLAKQGSAVLSPLFPELILRFFYELIAACNQSPKKNRLVALHIQDFSRKTLKAAIYTVAISVACLNFLSFLANLVANLPYNYSEEYAQDITFGGVTAAILVPSIVFFWQIVGDPRFKWFKVLGELSQPGEALKTPLGVLDWIQLGLMILVGGAAGLVIWLESLFLNYQHGANHSQIFANDTYATPFITLKRDAEFSSVTLAVVCFIAWQIIQAYIHIDRKPLGLVRPKDNLPGCSQIGRCMSRLFACRPDENPVTQPLIHDSPPSYGAV